MDDETNQKEEQEFFYRIDEMMLWLRSLIEIIDSKFLKNTYFANASNVNSETIKGYLDFIDNINENIDVVKVVYPDVTYYIPEFKKIFKQIYSNKLAVEEAENIFKKGETKC